MVSRKAGSAVSPWGLSVCCLSLGLALVGCKSADEKTWEFLRTRQDAFDACLAIDASAPFDEHAKAIANAGLDDVAGLDDKLREAKAQAGELGKQRAACMTTAADKLVADCVAAGLEGEICRRKVRTLGVWVTQYDSAEARKAAQPKE